MEFCAESEDGEVGEVGERRREGEKVEEVEETDLRRQGIEICGSDGDGGEAGQG